ncbi:MAG: SsrA-binding protein SmpB [Betaproteobacteria bacterium]|nr:MAG: SsrA-binding protein SmpB [Betaproteobacteria bacterium]
MLDQLEHSRRAVWNKHRLLHAGHCYNTIPGKRRTKSAVMSIVDNKKAYHDYFVEEKFEAGLALEGWEVKAIRAGRAQLKEAYVIVKNGEIVLLGAHVTPLPTASTHVRADPTRTRKLLPHRAEINRLIGKVERAGYTLTPLNLHFSKSRIKLEVGLARGKKQYDKRATIKEREWNREKQRLLRGRPGSGRSSRAR